MIHVVAGALTRSDGRLLIAQRPPGKHLAGGWEFPGGKLDAGESLALGLARELREELDVAIRDPRPLLRLRHTYPYGEVLLDMWVVSRYEREPRGMDGQALRWVTQDELEDTELLPADRPIVRALRLPERLTTPASPHYAVGEPTARDDARLHGRWCATAADALAGAGAGADFLVMGSALPDEHLARLCASVAVPMYARALSLEAAWALGATGISLLQP